MGHASSTIVLMNLIRLGNERVLQTYNCKKFRKAAIEVTRLTTGKHRTQSRLFTVSECWIWCLISLVSAI